MSKLLLEAAAKNHKDLLERVLGGEFGAFRAEDISAALLRAAGFGNIECISRLLAEGADPDYEDLDGDTSLMLATSNGHRDVVQWLIDVGCDLDLQSDRGRTALHMAAWWDRLRIMRMLIDAQCDVNLSDTYGDTPLMMAAKKGHERILNCLLAHPDINIQCRSYERDTVLHYASRKGHTECVKLLLNYVIDIEAKTRWGHTALHFATMDEHEETALVLVDRGANVNTADMSERTPLHYVVKKGMTRCTSALLERGAFPDAMDADHNTPLVEAVRLNFCDVVFLLIQYGCDVNTLGRCTIDHAYLWVRPIDIAISKGFHDLTKILVCAGCDLQMSLVDPDMTHKLVSHDPELADWLCEVTCAPKNLTYLCRKAIRTSMGYDRHILQNVKELPLPPTLKDFVKYTDLLEYVDNDRETNNYS